MPFLRSVNRFILISLALLGLSVSSAIASLSSATDPVFGTDSITIDSETGYEWLDLKESVGIGYNDMTALFSVAGGNYEGWRYATGAEVGAFWDSGGSNDCNCGAAGDWVLNVWSFWGPSYLSYEAEFITADSSNLFTHHFGSIATSGYPGSTPWAQVYEASVYDSANYIDMTNALVRKPVVPVPAAIWLFGTALIGLVGYGKRKSKVPV